jgi:hypothetical protein
MLGHVEVDNPASVMKERDDDEQNTERGCRIGEKSIVTSSPIWLTRKVFRVCEGGFLRLSIQRETVRSEISNPSFSDSPCTLGAHQRGIEAAIFRIRSRISRSFPGRPGRRIIKINYESVGFEGLESRVFHRGMDFGE